MIKNWNLLNFINRSTPIDVQLIVEMRRVIMEREGHFSDEWINWKHYAKVLEAKKMLLPD